MGVKRKFLSQVETEASVSPMINLLNEKKQKKNKKKKLMAASEAYMNESFDDDAFDEKKQKKDKKKKKWMAEANMNESFDDDAFDVPKKKEKKNKKGAADISMNSVKEEISEASEGKKKKKKKKLQESTSDNLDMDDNRDLMELEGSPKKNKKKKRKSDEYEISFVKEEEDLDLNESSYSHSSPKKYKGKKILDSESSSTLKSPNAGKEFDSPGKIQTPKSHRRKQDSPVRKKTKEEAALSENEEEFNENDDKMETATKKGVNGTKVTLWTSEEEVNLLSRIRENLTSNDEAVPYNKTLPNIAWDAIAFDNRSADDCRAKLKKMLSKIVKFKSLTMLLEEAEKFCVGRKNIKRPRDRFLQLFFEKRKADPSYNQSQNVNIFKEANLAWSNLPIEEKEEYEVQFRNELKKHKKSLDLPPELPRLPASVYYNIQTKKAGTKSNELRKKAIKTFSEMDFEDKIPYIHESFKEFYNYEKAVEKYKESHPEWKPKRVRRISNSLFEEYLDYLGVPKYKTNAFTAYLSHMKENGELDKVEDGKDRLKYYISLYQAISEEEKAKYADEAKATQKCFLENYNIWLEQQDEAVRFLIQKYHTPKIKFTSSSTSSLKFNNVVAMPMSKPRFPDEPDKPPKASKLYQLKFKRRFGDRYLTKDALRNDYLAAWKNLPGKEKAVYVKRAKNNQELYKENLLEYVRGLGQSANIYLGFKRAELFKYFKKDIFEKDFPNEEYPIYVSPKKTPKKKERKDSDDGGSEASLSDTGKSGGKGPNAAASDEDDDDEIEDEEEEEIDHAWASRKSSVEKKKASVSKNRDDSSSEEDDDEEEEEEDDDDDDDEDMESD